MTLYHHPRSLPNLAGTAPAKAAIETRKTPRDILTKAEIVALFAVPLYGRKHGRKHA